VITPVLLLPAARVPLNVIAVTEEFPLAPITWRVRVAEVVPNPLQFGFDRVWIGTPMTSAPQPFVASGADVAQVASELAAQLPSKS